MISLSKAEKSYIQAGIAANPPSRADGRALLDWRTIALETGVAPLSNGSARLTIGNSAGGGRTEIVAAAKLEVESIQEDSDAQDGGRIVCSVSCSPTAYPYLPNSTLDDLQSDLTSLLHQTLSHPTLHPSNLGILKSKKSWLLSLDLLVLSDAGNVLDALFLAARAALWDTRVPRTRAIGYKARSREGENKEDGSIMDVDQNVQSGFDTRHMLVNATDFELPDYWDEGEALDGRDRWPVAVTLNIEPATYYLDATNHEEAATPLRLLLAFSFPSTTPAASPVLQALRIIGPGELTSSRLKDLVKVGEKHAREAFAALNTKLVEEDVRRNQKERKRFEQSR